MPRLSSTFALIPVGLTTSSSSAAVRPRADGRVLEQLLVSHPSSPSPPHVSSAKSGGDDTIVLRVDQGGIWADADMRSLGISVAIVRLGVEVACVHFA